MSLAELTPAWLFGLDADDHSLAERFDGEPLVHHGSLERFAPLTVLPELGSVERLVERFHERPELVQTWFPPGDVRFTHWGRMSEALAHYEERARLQFNQVEQCVPQLRILLASVEAALGLTPGTATVTIIASTTGACTEPHFDNYPAITLQLRGRKRWQIGAVACPHTLDSVVLTDERARTHVARFHAGALPRALGDDASIVEMVPGSALFMPRGHIHHVESGEHTLALSIDLVTPMWTQLVVRRLAELLDRDSAWRGFVVGLAGTAAARERARAQLQQRLQELPRVIEQLLAEPEQLLVSSRQRHFRRLDRAQLRLEADAASAPLLRIEHPELGASEISLCPDLVPASRWLLSREQPFMQAQALAAAERAEPTNVGQLLDALLQAGALEQVEYEHG